MPLPHSTSRWGATWYKPAEENNETRPRSGAMAGRRYLAPEARGSGREEQPHVQGVVAAQLQEGLEEPSHAEGQEGQRE